MSAIIPSQDERNSLLIESQLKRHFAFNETYKSFLDEMIIGKKKQIRFRKWFYNRLRAGSVTIFKTDDEEYEFINKFGRGIWNGDQLRRTFDKNEMLIIIKLATDYGAFDY